MNINFSRFGLLIASIFLLAGAVNAQSDAKSKKPVKDKPFKIKSRTPPNENLLLDCNLRMPIYLNIFVSVTFDKSGKVSDARIEGGSGCQPFDADVLRVAKKIKFKPAVREGVPVTVTELVTYQISIIRINRR